MEFTVVDQIRDNRFFVQMANAKMQQKYSFRWPCMLLTESEIIKLISELQCELNSSAKEQFFVLNLYGSVFTARVAFEWGVVLRLEFFSAIPGEKNFYSNNGYLSMFGKVLNRREWEELFPDIKVLLLDWFERENKPSVTMFNRVNNYAYV